MGDPLDMSGFPIGCPLRLTSKGSLKLTTEIQLEKEKEKEHLAGVGLCAACLVLSVSLVVSPGGGR